jgi:hypothetical protein
VLRNQLNVLEEAVKNDIQANACKALNAGCFAADTKLWTPSGYKAVQDFVAGDMLYSRDEWDADAPVEVKLVEEVFVRYAGILALHAGGQVVRTTGEHPFFEKGKGWTACLELQAGDLIRTDDGWVPVEEVWDTGDWEVVYNVRVSDHHTYFVGEEGWGWSLWAHNSYYQELSPSQVSSQSADLRAVIASARQARLDREAAVAAGQLTHNGILATGYAGNFMAVRAVTPSGVQTHVEYGTHGSRNHSEAKMLTWLKSVGATQVIAAFSEHVPCSECSLRNRAKISCRIGIESILHSVSS